MKGINNNFEKIFKKLYKKDKDNSSSILKVYSVGLLLLSQKVFDSSVSFKGCDI